MDSEVSNKDTVSAVGHDGVVVGLLLGIAESGAPLVAFPGGVGVQIKARTTVALNSADIGSQVALMFENGDMTRPLVIGRIVVPSNRVKAEPKTVETSVDQDTLTLTADREIVLKCGKASITLTRAGKIILRGAYVLSRSSGVNKLKGASVQIN